MLKLGRRWWWLLLLALPAAAEPVLENDRYRLAVNEDGSVRCAAAGVSERLLAPEFVVMFSAHDPGYHRNHLNYPLAPRTAVRWANYEAPLAELNRWLATAEVRAMTQHSATVTADAGGERTWSYRDPRGQVVYRVTGPYARGTTDPFLAGTRTDLRARRAVVAGRTLRWEFPISAGFTFTAELTLPVGGADPQISHTLTAKTAGYYSAAFVGAPALPRASLVAVPQECAGRGLRQFNHLVSEGELKLPRAQLSTGAWSSALVVDAAESPFRIPTAANARFGLMLWAEDGAVRPLAFAPILGGAESRLAPDEPRTFRIHLRLQAGDWKEAYRDIARLHYRFRDQRDNSGPGSINHALERTIDYLVDRNGRNHAMWHAEQKYYDYWTDNSGLFKPFSPLFGLAAALVTDDEDFFRRRVLPQVEFALSRRSNVFAPYEVENNGQVKSRHRGLGASYLGAPQLGSLAAFLQHRTPAIDAAQARLPPADSDFAALLARYQYSGDSAALAAARRAADAALLRGRPAGGDDYLDYLELHEATGDSRYLAAAVEGAYGLATTLNLSPLVPDETVRVEIGGRAPVHEHSIGRHKRWGFPPPVPLAGPEQSVPAWRVALTGLSSPAYRGEFWMNHHGQLLRLAALTDDGFLRDLARWGMVGRFGSYAGDNRSKPSLIIEQPDAVEHPIWELNYATVNPGHAWEFAGALIDFLVSDAFHRSARQIDFPARTMHGASFRVRVYGDRPGRFYDEDNVRLWLPRGLITGDHRQIDYVAGYGNGRVYLALINQSFAAEDVSVGLNPAWVSLDGATTARRWTQNLPAEQVSVIAGRIVGRVPAKGIVAYALDGARARPQLQARVFDPATRPLGPQSFADVAAPFGRVHALLLSAGRGLTSGYVYTDALPEDVIVATLRYRQGDDPWQERSDAIFPYEFSPAFREGGGALQLEFRVENARQEVQRAPVITLTP